MSSDRTPRSAMLALLIAVSVGAIVGAGCLSKASQVEAADDPKQLIADTDAVCTAMASGDILAWRTPLVKSATWSMLIARGDAGEEAANCDAAKLIDRRWRQTLTCTASLATELAEVSGCRLPGRPLI